MFIDAVALQDKPRLTKDGYLVATAKVARTGIQLYTGDEMGRPELKVVRVYRPESEVFSTDSLASFVGKPFTVDHPSEAVTAENWKDYAVGSIGEGVLRDGEYIKVPLIMMDAAAIKEYQNGKEQLSMGYDAEIEWVQGVTDSGEEYDAVQRNIRINHIALVSAGRAGSARIGDKGGHDDKCPNYTGGRKMANVTKKVTTADGLVIEVDEYVASVIESLSNSLIAVRKKVEELEEQSAEDSKTVDAKDKELAAKDAQIEELTKQSMTADKLDAAIAERVALISEAKKVADIEYKGDAAAIRKQAVVAVLGDAAVEGKSEAYIEARFDVLRDSVGSTSTTTTQHKDSSDNGYNKFLDSLSNGYKRGN